MTKKTNKRSELMSGIITVVLCMSMLLGTTVAWFTKTVSNTGNRIEAGTLEVKLLEYNNESSRYEDISGGAGDIFAETMSGTRWEPGKTKVIYLAVKNEGKLALNYNMILDVKNDAGNSVALEEALTYAIVPGVNRMSDAAYTNWETILDAATASGGNNTGQVPAGQTTAASNGALTAGNADYFALAVHMNEEATNDYQNQAITIDVKIVAKQMASESDSFNNRYDEEALFEEEAGVVWLNRTFDEEGGSDFDGIRQLREKGATIKVNADATGNKYLEMVREVDTATCLFMAPQIDGQNMPADHGKKIIVQMDLSSANGVWLRVDPHTGDYWTLAKANASGEVVFNNIKLATISGDKWVNFAWVFDFDEGKLDIYVDGQLKVEDASLGVQSFKMIRMQMQGAGRVTVNVDNLKIYEGSAIRDLS